MTCTMSYINCSKLTFATFSCTTSTLRSSVLYQNLRRLVMAMSSPSEEYELAVTILNGLQTSVTEKMNSSRQLCQKQLMERMHLYLLRVGLKVEDLDNLNAIHIAGTKGKGSVSAMCERVMRAHGLKTGFYSSPHLLEVRERIRINGQPLTKSQFVSYFWNIYNKLDNTKSQYEGDMPAYFRFLTVMTFDVFLKEKVDVAIVEVGVGGTNDSTNVMKNPVVCGVTSLGYDHMSNLGDTLEKIAWHKGGICKPGHPCYVLPQPEGPLRVLAERATELKASSIEVVPPLSDYPGDKPVLGLAGDYQMTNASLAVQLCRTWLQRMEQWKNIKGECVNDLGGRTLHGVSITQSFPLTKEFYEGLRLCKWPGRSHTVRRSGVTFFLDGGHTPQSMEACADWFSKAADEEAKKIDGTVARVLLFNTTRKRNAKVFLKPLVNCGFEYAAFSPNITDTSGTNSPDQTNLMVATSQLSQRCEINCDAWLKLHSQQFMEGDDACSRKGEHMQEKCHGLDFNWSERAVVFKSLSQALRWCAAERGMSPSPDPQQVSSLLNPPPPGLTKTNHIQVLVAGSLHLVGAVMSVLGYTVEDL